MRQPGIAWLLAAAALLAPLAAAAQAPQITSIAPQPTMAGPPGTMLTVAGLNFGTMATEVYLPGAASPTMPAGCWFDPGTGQGSVLIELPCAYSGDVRVRQGGVYSDPFPFAVSFATFGHKWATASPAFTWYLNQNGAPGMPLSLVAALTTAGYDTWGCASGFGCTYGGTTALTGASHGDGWNVQYWSTLPWADPNLIAVTTYMYYPSTHTIYETDIHYNGADWAWSDGGSPTTLDVWNVAAHEEGHSLGLLDLYGAADAPKAMYGWTNNGDTSARILHADDVAGAEYLYPRSGRANFVAATPSGWWGPIVPRNTGDATNTSAPLPATLSGDVPGFINHGGTNNGLDCAMPTFWTDILLDNVRVGRNGWVGVFYPGEYWNPQNIPVTVRGGRHTYTSVQDAANEIVEANEGDNSFSAQFAWSPYVLADQVPHASPAPPEPGGMAALNCDGFQFTGNWWGAVGIVPTTAGDDYDLRLFNDYSGSLDGYQTGLAYSSSGGTETDFVVLNGNVAGYGQTRWAGITRYTAGAGGSVAVCQSNQVDPTHTVPIGYAQGVSTGEILIGPGQILKVHEFQLTAGYPYTFYLANLAGGADLNFSLMPLAAAHAGRALALAGAEHYNAGGDELFNFPCYDTGYYGLVVWKRGAADLALTATYEVIVGPQLANLNAQVTPPGFGAPLVARNAADAAYGNAPVPATLAGSAAAWYSRAVQQEGPTNCPGFDVSAWLDEETALTTVLAVGTPAPGSYQWFNQGPVLVQGGRHTFRQAADPGGLVAEGNEEDNNWSGQYVWSPLLLTKDSPLVRPLPPVWGYGPYANCDGLQFNRTPGCAWVIALAPTAAADDYDLVVYDDYVGSQSGYSHGLAGSACGDGATDFVVGHFAGTPTTLYPGAQRYQATERQSFAVDATDASGHDGGESAVFAGRPLAANRLADVYEADLVQGQRYEFRLQRLSDPSELWLEAFPATAGGVSPRGFGQSAVRWSGTEVRMVYLAQSSGRHPIVVFRTTGADASLPTSYTLSWQPTLATGVGDEPAAPTAVTFGGAWPNPTSAGARLEFALPGAAFVHVDLYDARGRRVRRLLAADLPVGRHALDWDGCNDRGQRVAAGVFWARLQAGGEKLTRRITVLR